MPTTTSKPKRPPIPGPFKVLVIPSSDVIPHPRLGLTSPQILIPKDISGNLQIAAKADGNGVQACFWAFDTKHKRKAIKDLRALADFLESTVVKGGNPPVS